VVRLSAVRTGSLYPPVNNPGTHLIGSWGSVVDKALRYKSEGPGIDSRCRRDFIPWHLTVPCALGSTQLLKMSTRLILGVKAAVA
jgi:hypothetical protein